MPGKERGPNREMSSEFRMTRVINQPRELVFDVVADIERYPEFVPGFSGARIDRQDADTLYVTQHVGIPAMSVNFRSVARLQRPRGITIDSDEWPFRRLHQEWTLEDLGESRTRVTFESHHALASKRAERLVGRFFDHVLRRTVDAFEKRIHEVARYRRRRSAR